MKANQQPEKKNWFTCSVQIIFHIAEILKATEITGECRNSWRPNGGRNISYGSDDSECS